MTDLDKYPHKVEGRLDPCPDCRFPLTIVEGKLQDGVLSVWQDKDEIVHMRPHSDECSKPSDPPEVPRPVVDGGVVHLAHHRDGYPFCWPQDRDDVFRASGEDSEVTCPECVKFIKSLEGVL